MPKRVGATRGARKSGVSTRATSKGMLASAGRRCSVSRRERRRTLSCVSKRAARFGAEAGDNTPCPDAPHRAPRMLRHGAGCVFRDFSIDLRPRAPYTPFHRRGAAVHRLVGEGFDGLRDCRWSGADPGNWIGRSLSFSSRGVDRLRRRGARSGRLTGRFAGSRRRGPLAAGSTCAADFIAEGGLHGPGNRAVGASLVEASPSGVGFVLFDK